MGTRINDPTEIVTVCLCSDPLLPSYNVAFTNKNQTLPVLIEVHVLYAIFPSTQQMVLDKFHTFLLRHTVSVSLVWTRYFSLRWINRSRGLTGALWVPQRDLHSWGVPWPCCPTRFVSARGCWHRTGPGCTGGPGASPGLSRAPSSGLWPSARCGCAWSDPSPQTETLRTV